MKNFWQKLGKPFFVLAPMDDVTDVVFRQVVANVARPDVFFTEFTNVDGLMSRGRARLIHKFEFTAQQHPIVAQIWGMKPENYLEISKLIVAMGFDGIDINMGCPERGVLRAGACAGLIDNRKLAAEIISATIEGAGELPVSVKTRIGLKQIVTADWIGFLLGQKLAALTVHGRTASEMSKVPVHWDEIGKAVGIRDSMKVDTVVIGNGDVQNREHGVELAKKYRVDGIMIGRGIFGDVAAFAQSIKVQEHKSTREEKIKIAIEHVKLFEKTWGKNKNPQLLKKFFKIYISGFDGAAELRTRLMLTSDYSQMLEILEKEK